MAQFLFKDALEDGNVVVITLSNLFNDESHTVLIYAFENYKFKVKDSYGKKYEIPIDRPDSIQVSENYLKRKNDFSNQGKIMQFVKPVNDQSRWILDRIFPGNFFPADFLMQKTEHDRMEAVATYLAQQIKVKTFKGLFCIIKIKYIRMTKADCLWLPVPYDLIALQLI